MSPLVWTRWKLCSSSAQAMVRCVAFALGGVMLLCLPWCGTSHTWRSRVCLRCLWRSRNLTAVVLTWHESLLLLKELEGNGSDQHSAFLPRKCLALPHLPGIICHTGTGTLLLAQPVGRHTAKEWRKGQQAMTHIDINWLYNSSLKKNMNALPGGFISVACKSGCQQENTWKLHLKNRFLTLCSFFSHFSGSTAIQLWIWNGAPSWPTSTLYSNPTDCDTVSPTSSIPWIFREIINMASYGYCLPLETTSTVGTMLLAQGQIGLGFASTHVSRCWINWKGCQGSGWTKILSTLDHHASQLNNLWPKKQFLRVGVWWVVLNTSS